MRTGLKLAWAIALAMLSFSFGCGPEVSEEELGKVEFRVPPIPGADDEFPLPSKVLSAKVKYEAEHPSEDKS